jgi:hypothetical protein
VTFQLGTVGYLALGNLVALFAKKTLGNGCILMQHPKADLSLYGDGDLGQNKVSSRSLYQLNFYEYLGQGVISFPY